MSSDTDGTTVKKKRKSKKTGASKPTAKKSPTKKSASASKKASGDAAPKKADAGKAAPTHMVGSTVVLTPDGRKPKHAVSAFLSAKQIKVVKGFNPRVDIGDVTTLARSIKKSGLLQNLVVRPSGDGKTYQLVAGERRLTALLSLGGKFIEAIPVNIRLDLEGKDDEARAVAVAESSPDGRLNLNPIEVGRVATELSEKGWSTGDIAHWMAVHPKRVSRALQLMETPVEVQKRIAAGEWSQAAGLEFAKLPDAAQAELRDKIGASTTAEDVKRLRRGVERIAEEARVEKGEAPAGTSRRGRVKATSAPTWKPAREKQEIIAQFAHELAQFGEDARMAEDYMTLRGALWYALFDRGDIETPVATPLDASAHENPKAAEKANKLFDKIVDQEARRYATNSAANEEEETDAA